MLRNYFKQQLDQYKKITSDIYDQITYKRVWSGKMMEVGDTVLHALVYPKGEDDPQMIVCLDRELEELNTVFDFVHYEKEMIPVLKFRDDPKVRNVQRN